MDVALAGFIGSGLLTVSSGLHPLHLGQSADGAAMRQPGRLPACASAGVVAARGGVAPDALRGVAADVLSAAAGEASLHGYDLVAFLAQHNAAALKDILESSIAGIWESWQPPGGPPGDALRHLQQLPPIMAQFAPPASYFTRAIARAGNSDNDAAADASARAIAAEMIMRAREKNAFEKAKLNEALCYFLLERLFAVLLAKHDKLQRLQPDIQAFLSQKTCLPGKAGLLEKAGTSQKARSSQKAGATAKSSSNVQDAAASRPADGAPRQASTTTTLRAGGHSSAPAEPLSAVAVPGPVPAPVPEPASPITVPVAAPGPVPGPVPGPGPAAISTQRDSQRDGTFAIEQLEASNDAGQLRNAAQHYRAQIVMAAHRRDIISKARRQLWLGRVLHRLGALQDDGESLTEAALLLRSGLENLHGDACVAGSVADSVAGSVVVSGRAGNAGRDDHAGQSKISRSEQLAARMALGEVLWKLAARNDDGELAEQAVTAFETLCAGLSRDRDAAIWVAAHSALGALYSAQWEAGEAASRELARPGPSRHLSKSVSAFEAALLCISKAEAPLKWAGITSQLASLLALVALHSGDYEALSQVAEMKLAAIDRFEAAGADAAAQSARNELHLLLEDLQRLGAGAADADAAALSA